MNHLIALLYLQNKQNYNNLNIIFATDTQNLQLLIQNK